MSFRSTLLVGTALAVLAGVVAFDVFGSSNDASGQPPNTAARGLAWPDGSSRSYKVAVDTVVLLGHEKAKAAKLRQDLIGKLHLRVERTAGDVVHLRFCIEPERFVINGVDQPELAARLTTPFRARFSRNGLPVAFEMPTHLDATERRLLEEYVRIFQVVVPPRAQSRWQTEEKHSTGTYTATYVVAGDRLQKNKVVYSACGGEAQREVARVVRSTTEIELCTVGPWIRSMSIDEEVSVPMAPGVRAASTVRASLVPHTFEPTRVFEEREAAVAERANHRAARHDPTTGRQPRKPMDRAAFLRLMQRLDEVKGRGVRLVSNMAKKLVVCPELAEVVAEAFPQKEVDDATKRMLLHVLELAGTRQAQTVLARELTNVNRGHEHRVTAIVAIGGVASPSPTALQTLWATYSNRHVESARDLSNTSLLSIGAMGKNLRGTKDAKDIAEYEVLRGRLVEALHASADHEVRTVALKAMANTGDPELARIAAGELGHASASVRAAAAESVGSLRGHAVRQRLVDRLTVESDGRVRRFVVQSLQALPTQDYAGELVTIKRLATRERDALARGAMARYLGARLGEHPELRKTLLTMLETETHRPTIKYLAALLYSKKAPRRGS